MGPDAKYFGWIYLRAFVWVLIVTFALRRSTGNQKISKGFFMAHMAALAFGALTDGFMVNYAPKSWLDIEVLQWVFVMPIAIFTVISLWIAGWESPVHAPDAFMTLVPITAWGLMVIYGWQKMWYCHVLGAWFVSAASGGVDLYARCGPPWAKKRNYLTRFVGYAVIVMIVYLLLPKTEFPG
jgi:hypothetical protein